MHMFRRELTEWMTIALVVATLPFSWASAASPSSQPAAERQSGSMHGKVYVGYQGWFIPEVAGQPKWIHYSPGGPFAPGHCNIDMWPDVSDFSPDERVATLFRH